eukprot:Lithocolla_globosa_v1_NODE_84_length_6699_cov_54.834938.p10 type:complete len:100 gc:universal NODE_84_length_6699_cov_54.834938:682-383(-)
MLNWSYGGSFPEMIFPIVVFFSFEIDFFDVLIIFFLGIGFQSISLLSYMLYKVGVSKMYFLIAFLNGIKNFIAVSELGRLFQETEILFEIVCFPNDFVR